MPSQHVFSVQLARPRLPFSEANSHCSLKAKPATLVCRYSQFPLPCSFSVPFHILSPPLPTVFSSISLFYFKTRLKGCTECRKDRPWITTTAATQQTLAKNSVVHSKQFLADRVSFAEAVGVVRTQALETTCLRILGPVDEQSYKGRKVTGSLCACFTCTVEMVLSRSCCED